jgi:hypothetical protein
VIEVTAESYNRRTIGEVWQHPDKSEIGSSQFKVNRKETVSMVCFGDEQQRICNPSSQQNDP